MSAPPTTPVRRFTRSFQVKLVGATLAAQLVMLSLLIWQGWSLMDRQLRDVVRNNVERSNTLLIAALGTPLAQRDYATLQELLDQMVDNGMLDYIVVEDHRQRRVAASGWPAETPLPEPSAGVDETELNQLHVRRKIALANVSLGEVQYGLSLGFIHGARSLLANSVLNVGLVGILLGLVLQVPLTMWLLRRLNTLKDAAQRFSAGDLGQRIAMGGNDELTQLAGAFNDMADSLADMLANLRRSEARFHHAVQGSNDGIWDWDMEHGDYYFSPRHQIMLGYSEGTFPATKDAIFDLIHPDDSLRVRTAMDRHLTEREPFALEFRLRHRDGHYIWCLSRGQAVWAPDGRAIRFAGATTDVSDQHKVQDELVHLAHFDPLTHLPNRTLLGDRITMALSQARRQGSRVGVALLDLDGFKPVNDSFGHATGDMVLVDVANRLRAALRSVDTVARLGGDEFVLVLGCSGDDRSKAGCSDGEFESLLKRVLATLREPFTVDATSILLSGSIGITFFPDDDVDTDTLLRHADQAMYVAKQSGRNRYHVFDPSQDRDLQSRREARQRIGAALGAGELVLYYQPKVNMRQGSVVGAEALIRWQHPQRGLLAPGEFLPAIEGTDLDVAVSEWVIENALRQMDIWAASGLTLTVSVNISARHLQDARFVPYLESALVAHPTISPERLELEVVESAALVDVAGVSARMEQCRQLGVRFALDDFGTGYASLAYLRRLPIDVLKIDQSFVRDMLHDTDDMAIVEGVVSLAMAFRDEVIAEGVETVDHGIMLMYLGCDLAQGYGIARPMPADALPEWVAAWRGYPQWAELGTIRLAHGDLALLYVKADLRRWVESMLAWLGDENRTAGEPPPLDSNSCRFGLWLHGEGRKIFGNLPTFAAIYRVHESLHKCGQQLVGLVRGGQIDAARQRLPDFLAIRDQLMVQIGVLIFEVANRAPPTGGRERSIPI